MKDLKVIFMGTPDFACPVLDWLIENTNVCLVVTKPDKEVGRNRDLSFSPVKKLALENNISVFQPVKIRTDYEIISEANPDIIITCAYGQIVPKEVLDIPRLGCINIHASLLPKYRGSAPIQWSLINGEEKTGVTLMYMDEHMDTGDMIAKREYIIKNEDNIETLHNELSIIGRDLLKDNLESIINGTNKREKQNENDATYAPMIKREDELISFDDLGKNIVNKIRAFYPWPIAYFMLGTLEVKVLDAHFEKTNNSEANKIVYEKKSLGIGCKDGIIYLDKIKPFGKKEMPIIAFLNGYNKEISYANEETKSY